MNWRMRRDAIRLNIAAIYWPMRPIKNWCLKRPPKCPDGEHRCRLGHARGIALRQSFGTIVAQVAEISVNPEGQARVHKVWCAVDPGEVVNPDTFVAQMESGIIYGLTAALYGEISIIKGRVVEQNFPGL